MDHAESVTMEIGEGRLSRPGTAMVFEAGETMIETTPTVQITDLLAESVRRLRASLPAERIYLFGSRARDEADADSDYDFLVVVRDSPLPRYKREQQAFRPVRHGDRQGRARLHSRGVRAGVDRRCLAAGHCGA